MSVDIRDVPCAACCNGYDRPHTCDIPDFCPCDRRHLHIEPGTYKMILP